MSRDRMKKMHDRRREDGVCIQNKTHGKATRGGRCEACWRKKLDAERQQYATKKQKMRQEA